jgi:hypothetical protein
MDRPAMTTRRRASHRLLISHRRLIFVAADKVGMNSLRLLDLGLLVLGPLGLLPLLLCGLHGKEDSIKPEALITGQTEGLKGGFKEWVDGWMGGRCVRYGWIGG